MVCRSLTRPQPKHILTIEVWLIRAVGNLDLLGVTRASLILTADYSDSLSFLSTNISIRGL
jgi:hypothetical protein